MAVGAGLIILNLLKGDADGIDQGGLREAGGAAPTTEIPADMDVDLVKGGARNG